MGHKVGLNCKIYRNTGSYATPTWTEITLARDVTLNLEITEAEAASRGSNFKEYLDALMDAGIEFDVLYDSADTQISAMRTAFFDRTAEDLLALDGDSSTTGNQGLRFTGKYFSFTRNEPLEEALTASVTAKPVPNDDQDPNWFTVA